MADPRIGLEQWQALVAVVETGSHARAAERIHKTQSTVSYAVGKIESLLGVKAFELQGRRSILTPTGQLLYQRAKLLLDQAAATEAAARRVSAGWEPEIRVAMEQIFPHTVMLEALERFSAESPHTRIELFESVLAGTAEALLTGAADIAIGGTVPQGFLGDSIVRMRLVPVARPDHPLHSLGRALTLEDLRQHRALIVRESGSVRSTRTIVEAAQRWTVTHVATSIHAARLGHGYAWLPEDKIGEELGSGALKALPMREGADRYAELYLILAHPDSAGPGVRRLSQILRECATLACSAVQKSSAISEPPPVPSPASVARPPSAPRKRAPRPRQPSS